MKAKEYLSQAFYIDKKINALLIQQKNLKDRIYGVSAINYGRDKVQTSSTGGFEKSIARLADIEKDINRTIDKFYDLKKEIQNKIKLVDNENEKILLTYRYICFLNFVEIAYKMNYSYRNIHRLHLKALQDFEKILNKDE